MRVSSPSATALLILRSQFLLANDRRYQKLFDQETVDWYEAFLVAAGDCYSSSFSGLWRAFILRIIEKISIPGIYLHYHLRKQEIRSILYRLIEHENVTQVVVLAAGFDPLGAVFANKFPKVSFYEIDLPATQQVKSEALTMKGFPKNLTLIPGTHGLCSVKENLVGSSFKQNNRTIFILEGILMYLTESEVIALLLALYSLSPQEGTLIFTFMERWSGKNIQFRNASCLVTPWLRLKGEPFRWGIERDVLAILLSKYGWKLTAMEDHVSFRNRYLGDPKFAQETLAVGECLAVAESTGMDLFYKRQLQTNSDSYR